MLQQFSRPRQDHQHIVEVVRHSPRESSQHFHFLRLPEFLFQPRPLRFQLHLLLVLPVIVVQHSCRLCHLFQ